MMVEVTGAVASIFLLVASVVVSPTVARCPDGYALMGVRLSGRFACYTVPPPGCGGATGPDVPCPEPSKIDGRIYCTGGMVPVVVDDRVAACARLPPGVRDERRRD